MHYTLAHAATCLPDYWGGHHLPHISVPVYRSMTAGALRGALRAEVIMGAITGAETPAEDDDSAYAAMLDAVQELEVLREHPFADLEEEEDVCAFFVFLPAA